MQSFRRQLFKDFVEHQSEDQLVQLVFTLAVQLQRLEILSDDDARRVLFELEAAGVAGGSSRAA